jgi:acetolactate synthase-1/3 small subunit
MPVSDQAREIRSIAPCRPAVLELLVQNHPGVMSHVCGLFSRRAYNVEAILCLPAQDGSVSRIWLLVREDERLEQMIRQMWKLEDVQLVQRHGADHAAFERLEELFQIGPAAGH